MSENIEAHKDISLQNDHIESDDEVEPLLVPEPVKKNMILPNISAKSLPSLLALTSLIAVDSLGNSLTSKSWVVYYFIQLYKLSSANLGIIFGGASVISAICVIVSAPISKKLGPLRMMLASHITSSLLLFSMGFPFPVAEMVSIYIIRGGVRAMDLPSKHVFISMVVQPNERTTAIGFINATKTFVGMIGPIISGFLSSKGKLWTSFFIAGILRLTYDVGLYTKFYQKFHDK